MSAEAQHLRPGTGFSRLGGANVCAQPSLVVIDGPAGIRYSTLTSTKYCLLSISSVIVTQCKEATKTKVSLVRTSDRAKGTKQAIELLGINPVQARTCS